MKARTDERVTKAIADYREAVAMKSAYHENVRVLEERIQDLHHAIKNYDRERQQLPTDASIEQLIEVQTQRRKLESEREILLEILAQDEARLKHLKSDGILMVYEVEGARKGYYRAKAQALIDSIDKTTISKIFTFARMGDYPDVTMALGFHDLAFDLDEELA